VSTNVLYIQQPEEQISKLLSAIGQPARIQILIVIGAREACVCHLEAALGVRQASISQHLMVLRKVGLVASQRDGRNIFYSLTGPEIIHILEQAACLAGSNLDQLRSLAVRPVPGCPCPHCNPGIDPKSTCRNFRLGKPS
jgi:DNA-binding transcriptional ArsR family regulator